MIVSTCNRVELSGCRRRPTALRSRQLSLAANSASTPAVLAPHLYEYRDKEAVSHLFRMAASLDSMVVGEPQILGQVKEAFAVARAAGTVSGQLEHLLQSAFAAAKKARSETGIGSNSVSIASVAVDLARKIFGSLEGPHRLPGRRRQNERDRRAASRAAGRRRHPGLKPHRRARPPHGRGVRRRNRPASRRLRPALRSRQPAPTSSSAPPARRIPSSAPSTGTHFCTSAAIAPCSSSILPSRATSIR